MKLLTEPVIVILLLTNLMILGSSSLSTCIRLVAIQGVLLGFLPLFVEQQFGLRTALLAGGSMVVKGVIFPWLLSRAMREAAVRREVEPMVGYKASILVGVAALVFAEWAGSRLPLPSSGMNPMVVPMAIFMMISGLFLIVSRKKALTQVLGYLVLENGIYSFGVGLALREHLLVELCVLLDVFVAVFVMGIIIFHISREFDHIDVDQLSRLKDWHK